MLKTLKRKFLSIYTPAIKSVVVKIHLNTTSAHSMRIVSPQRGEIEWIGELSYWICHQLSLMDYSLIFYPGNYRPRGFCWSYIGR